MEERPPRSVLDVRLEQFLELAPDALVIVDARGIVVLANSQLARLFGYEPGELPGQPIELLVPARARASHALHRARYAEEARARPMGVGLDLAGRRRDGSEFPVEISLSPLETAEGRFVMSAVRDVSERRRAAAERDALRRERAAQEQASRLKDDFLAVLSHELRTPLNAVLGWAYLLRARPPDAATLARGLDVIERNARAQAQVVEDLLDVSRVVTGRLRVEERPVDLVETARSALEVVQLAAAVKELRLDVRLAAEPLRVAGDPDRLRQVLVHLLTNAVKFTPAGGEVRLAVEREDGEARVTVADSGTGIAPEFLPHVFERFRQADSSPTRRFGGLGLGLAIVRHLVELHGGSVEAESPGPGRGATFRVRLPLRSRSRPEPAPPPLRPGARRLDGLKVLVVDDQPDERELLDTILGASGALVRTAPSAREALAALESWRPQLLVSDIAMPDLDGYELLRRVREREAERGWERVPALAVTAHARVEDRDRALAAGFERYLPKPIDPARLAEELAALAAHAAGGTAPAADGGGEGGPPGAAAQTT